MQSIILPAKKKVMKEKNFLDIDASVFRNKKNGQINISLPKKHMIKKLGGEKVSNLPKKMTIRIKKWW